MTFKITLPNLKAYIEGNTRYILDKLNNDHISAFVGVTPLIREQIAYRMDVCKDSCPTKCKHCGCNTPGKFFVDKSCGGGKYPDIMSEEAWAEYKKKNNI
jgi:hypothetical protein